MANNNAKVYIVEAPVQDFVGVGAAGIHFANGKAEVREGWVLEWYKEHGYKVTEKEAEPKTVDKMTVEELKAYAAKNGIDISEAKNKGEILALIKDNQ